jgi:hypothetical protein
LLAADKKTGHAAGFFMGEWQAGGMDAKIAP